MGGPDSMEAIEPFLENLFLDPEIFTFPLAGLLRKPLARFIAKKRSGKVAVHYRSMGGKSPLPGITEAQRISLAERLGQGWSVHVAMRYWHPFADEAVAQAKKAGAERVVILPLYPHFSRATTGSSIADLERALMAGGLGSLPRRVVRSWQDYEPYIDSLAGCVAEALAGHPEAFILFSAHGLPVKLIEQGDPYLAHIQSTVARVMDKFPQHGHMLAFQSRAGPVKWLEPSTESAIGEIARRGVKDVVVVAVSFVSDHIETLCEIDEQYRDLAEKSGIISFRRAPSLNVRGPFIDALEGLARRESSLF